VCFVPCTIKTHPDGNRAYGKQRDTGAVVTDHKFTGQKLDGTGLQYYNARYYDPAIGVFISPDAVVPDATNVFDYNRYMYVAGNPLRLTDSSGHFWDTVADVVSIGYDIYEISQNGLTWETGGALAADVAGAAVPFMPAPGACLRWCDDVAQYSDEAWEGAQNGWNATKRFFGYGDEAAQYGDDAAAAAKAGADCLTNSFSGDTLVMTAGGAKPIAELVEGDLVLAYNEATGKVGPYPIVDTISHIDPEIVLLTIDGELIETTAEHPFYEMESAPWLAVGALQGRWTDAIDLQAGDLVWQADGTSGVVQAVEIVARQQRMYNLTVDVAHTFFVGRGQWLVHNDCWTATGSLTNTENALSHWNKHKGEFPQLNNSLEYVREAQKFLSDPPSTALVGARGNGDIVIYDPASNVFAVGLSDGTPRTMFAPDPSKHGFASNLEYFYAQLK